MKFLSVVALCFLLVSVACGKRIHNRQSSLNHGLKYRGVDVDKPNDEIKQQWYQQTVDHYDPLNNATFPQLYYVNSSSWGGNSYPIFVLLGGEGPLNPDAVGSHFVLGDYAARFGALIVAVEHRFYGQSFPAADLSTQSLRLLSSQQALADYADFVVHVQQEYNASDSAIISFGGSYSGALSAWFRAKYPTIIHGSIATSAPVNAQLDFPQYFEVVQDSIGASCAARVQRVTALVSAMMSNSTGRSQAEEIFSACSPIETDLDVTTFMSSLTDGICEIVQYNMDNNDYTPFNIQSMCAILEEGETDEEALAAYAKFNSLFNEFSGSNCTSVSYQQMIQEMQDITTNSSVVAARSWTWQTCTEFGYYQTAESTTEQPFSELINLEYFLQQCNDIFGVALTPRIDAIHNIYGGLALKTTKIVLPNGSIDPWHALGILNPSCASFEYAKLMNGTAHCADLYPPTPHDVIDLTNIREIEIASIAEWLGTGC